MIALVTFLAPTMVRAISTWRLKVATIAISDNWLESDAIGSPLLTLRFFAIGF